MDVPAVTTGETCYSMHYRGLPTPQAVGPNHRRHATSLAHMLGVTHATLKHHACSDLALTCSDFTGTAALRMLTDQSSFVDIAAVVRPSPA